jgi:5-methylthioadenosine/S-adenosylhomocysteine deaminase
MPHPFLVHPGSVAGGAAALNGFRLSAGLIWPVSSPPIPNGAILVGPEGRISAVGPQSRVPQPPDFQSLDAPDAVLLPGLVNTHTHLELSGFAGLIPEDSFFDWIQHIRRKKGETRAEEFVVAARAGVEDAWKFGATTVADTGDTGAVARALHELGGRGIVYQEVFGPHPDQEEGSFRGLVDSVQRLQPFASDRVRIGVSPHAPYTVSGPLFRRVAEYAHAERLPVALHLAESREESSLIKNGTGAFAEMWQRRGIPLPRPAASPVGYLNQFGILGPDTLVIHAVQVTDLDRRTLRERGCGVALCPRSNARHGHGSPPIAEYLRDGLRAGLGTDSVASVESLDLFAEARAAREFSGSSAQRLVELLTLGGARALGLDGEIGTLETGKWADLCVLRVGLGLTNEETAGRILETGATNVIGTWIAGRRVYQAHQSASATGGH